MQLQNNEKNKKTPEQIMAQLIQWINKQISKKNIPSINSLQSLFSGNIFLQIISIYYPKKVDLTKTFMKPKDQYQILQNFKQLLIAFNKIGWKAFDPQKFKKKKQKDCIILGNFIKKALNEQLSTNQQETKRTQNTIQQKQVKYKNMNRISMGISEQKQAFQKLQTRKQRQIQEYEQMQKNNSQTGVQCEQMAQKQQLKRLDNFKNMKITKLQKQKAYLLNKIMQIQSLLIKQKHKANNQQQNNTSIQIKNIQQLKNKIINLIDK